MNTVNTLQSGLRIFFFLATFLAMRHGSIFGIALSLVVFLVMEYFTEELQEKTHVEYIRQTPYIE